MALSFEWDKRKAESNLRAHGVSFGEATTVFADPLSIAISDPPWHTDFLALWIFPCWNSNPKSVA